MRKVINVSHNTFIKRNLLCLDTASVWNIWLDTGSRKLWPCLMVAIKIFHLILILPFILRLMLAFIFASEISLAEVFSSFQHYWIRTIYYSFSGLEAFETFYKYKDKDKLQQCIITFILWPNCNDNYFKLSVYHTSIHLSFHLSIHPSFFIKQNFHDWLLINLIA